MVDSTVASLTAAAALDGTELFYLVQGGADRKLTTAASRASATKTPTLSSQAYTTIATDLVKWLAVTSGASDATITLLSAATAGDGAIQWFSKGDGAAGKVFIAGLGFTAWLNVQGDCVALRSDGANWSLALANIKPSKEVFTSSGTWTKNGFAKKVRVVAIGPGGPGGSGARRATGGIRTGGAGGGPGAAVEKWLSASILGSTETVTVPAGPSGAPSITVDTTNGTAGTPGSPTTFGGWVTGAAGLGGAAGGNANALPGGSQLQLSNMGVPATGGSSSSTGPGVVGADAIVGNAGPGGSADAANVARLPAAGSKGSILSVTPVNGGAAGTSGNPGGNGSDVTDTDNQIGGGGGGGGFYATGTAGTAGGNGGNPGGSGGGGAASDNGFASGAGGAGGRGEIRVWQYFG